MHTGLLLLCVFHCSHPIEQHATYCYKYTASDVRTDLLCPLEREQRKSQFNPIMTISNGSYLKIAQINDQVKRVLFMQLNVIYAIPTSFHSV